jgi:hypothetical protein
MHNSNVNILTIFYGERYKNYLENDFTIDYGVVRVRDFTFVSHAFLRLTTVFVCRQTPPNFKVSKTYI